MAHCAHNQQLLRARATTPGGSFSVFLVVLSLVVSSTLAVSQERHLLPLDSAVDAALIGMQKLADLLDKVRRDCSDRSEML